MTVMTEGINITLVNIMVIEVTYVTLTVNLAPVVRCCSVLRWRKTSLPANAKKTAVTTDNVVTNTSIITLYMKHS